MDDWVAGGSFGGASPSGTGLSTQLRGGRSDSAVVAEPNAARTPGRVPAGVDRPPGPPGRRRWRSQPVQLGIAGVIAGLISWWVLQTQMWSNIPSGILNNIAFDVLTGTLLVIILLNWTSAWLGDWAAIWQTVKRALPIVLGTTLGFGLISAFVYQAWQDTIRSTAASDGHDYAWMLGQSHISRGMAWALTGVAVGVAMGWAARSRPMTAYATLGGGIGGFLGGAAFDFFAGDTVPRLLGLLLLGGSIGLAIGLAELARRKVWLEIISGPGRGREITVVREVTNIGSAADNDIVLPKSTASPYQAQLRVSPLGSTVQGLDAAQPIRIDARSAEDAAPISNNEVIRFGSSEIRFRFRGSKPLISRNASKSPNGREHV